MSTTLQAVIVVVAVAALSIVAVDSLDVWKHEDLLQNEKPAVRSAEGKAVYAADAEAGTVSVLGRASKSVEPDILEMRIGVQTQDASAEAALSSNSDIMNKVTDALADAGINREEISTYSLSVHPVYGEYNRTTGTSPLVGFAAENIVLIRTERLGLAADVIDGASAAGANRIDGIRFALSEDLHGRTQNELLQEAVLDAKARANEALKPLAKSVYDVHSMDLSPASYGPYDVQYSMAKAESFSSAPVFSSPQSVSVSVHIVFMMQ